MELLRAGTGLVIAISALIALLLALYLTGKCIYHMYKIVNNCTGRNAFLFGALLLGMPSQFNAEGNEHRLQLLRLLPKLLAAYLTAFGLKYGLAALASSLP